MATKHYSNDEITVKWQSDLCIHSEKCFKGLKDVFNPNQRPWIQLEGADSDTIMKQIDQCPSGALSYARNDDNNEANTNTTTEIIVETIQDGPLMVYGNMTVKHDGDEHSKESKVTAFCRCGASENKPYCDGSHKKIGFTG